MTRLDMWLLHVEHWAILSGGQTVILVALGMLATQVLVSRIPPRALYGLWLVVFLRLAVPWTPASPMSTLPWLGHVWTATSGLWLPRSGSHGLLDRFGPMSERPLEWAFIIWGIGVVVLMSAREVANRRWCRLIRTAQPVSTTKTTRMGLPVLETSAVDRPMQVGVFRPRLLVPMDFLQALTEAQWSHVRLHEASHARHRDLMVLWLVQTICMVYWFNPAVWLALQRLNEARELAADYDALRALSSDTAAYEYASTLVHLLDEPGGSAPRWSTTAGLGSPFPAYRRRVTQILRYSQHRQVWPAVLTAAIMVALGMSVGITPLRSGIRATFWALESLPGGSTFIAASAGSLGSGGTFTLIKQSTLIHTRQQIPVLLSCRGENKKGGWYRGTAHIGCRVASDARHLGP